ncbi:hypothetical protein WICPIJ_006323 [Wickerhamomyces pijperi]|uniref:Uncharacterized protein n=1 Tax=Wickerhamomyces pijperi TaxID=599730 RepID=A0A9P8Q2I4_WICPI|nr:hypothetical protein WICPIJ_006323 [Wickerhamomyces pijperi]
MLPGQLPKVSPPQQQNESNHAQTNQNIMTQESQQLEGYATLWTWYIVNLALGQYENINKDLIKLRQLDQFIMKFNSDCFNDVCTLFILPLEKFNYSANNPYLEKLLTSYHCKHSNHNPNQTESQLNFEMDQVKVTPLGLITTDEVILMVKDPSQTTRPTELKGDMPSASITTATCKLENDSNSVISGDPGFTPSVVDLDMDAESSIDKEKSSSSFSSDCYSLIDSDDVSDVDEDEVSRLGASLARVTTVSNDSTSLSQSGGDDDQSEYPSVSETEDEEDALPFPSKIAVNEEETEGQNNNEDINLSIIIFKNLQNNTKKVAIRQLSESNEFTSDWILYDDEFNFKNLQLLNLTEVLEWGSMCTKILIYSNLNYGKILDPVSQETSPAASSTHTYDDDLSDAESLDSEFGDENDLTVMEFDGGTLLNRSTYATMTNTSTHSNDNNTIKYINTNSRRTSRANSIITQPTSRYSVDLKDLGLDLSKVETRNQIRSIKSELYLASGIGAGSSGGGVGTGLMKSKSNPGGNNGTNMGSNGGSYAGHKHRFSIGKKFKSTNTGDIIRIKSNVSQAGDQKCSIM